MIERWTAETVQDLVARRLGKASLLVVSNREPYLHRFEDGELRWERTVGGLVTALDPVLQATAGTWIAHGAGPADRKAVDPDGRVAVPPKRARYTLRRVWLTDEEERGYYLGFANGTLWPLCHVAYVRPTFRPSDWTYYRTANEIFCRAVLEEARPGAAVWIQDYHLALLPALLRRSRPDLRLAHFWHIPWPAADVFQICPWKRELLEGLLANDVLGFHTCSHCDNFLDAVAGELEANVDRQRSTVRYRGHTTEVRPFPIGVDAEAIDAQARSAEVAREMVRLREQYGLVHERIAVGLDRFDYTKGIPERLQAVDRFLARNPEWAGRFVFVQAGVGSRERLPAYRELGREIDRLVRHVNRRRSVRGRAPVVRIEERLSPAGIHALYRIADCMVVTSLQDGMNLVAKEYVAARVDGDGTLLLSEFTGAARELPDALLVNPYDVTGTAEALATALALSEPERRARMSRLRDQVAEHNIYRWAGSALDALLRQPVPGAP